MQFRLSCATESLLVYQLAKASHTSYQQKHHTFCSIFFWNVNLKRHHCWYAGEFPRRSFISPRKMSPSAKWRSKFEMTGSSCLESNNHSTGQSLLVEPYQIMVWDYHIMVEFNVSREQRQRDASEDMQVLQEMMIHEKRGSVQVNPVDLNFSVRYWDQ